MSVSNILNPTTGLIASQFLPPSPIIPDVLVPTYGSFTCNTTIDVSGINVPTPILFDYTEISSGVYIDLSNTSHIKVISDGVYKVSYSIQFDKSGGGTSQVDIWLRNNGFDIPRSASQATIQGNNGEVFVMCEYLLSLTTLNYLEVYFTSANDTTISATTFPVVAGVRPEVPAVILNVYKIA
jgi:hypothetical protein